MVETIKPAPSVFNRNPAQLNNNLEEPTTLKQVTTEKPKLTRDRKWRKITHLMEKLQGRYLLFDRSRGRGRGADPIIGSEIRD
jgi:hypothetical protein